MEEMTLEGVSGPHASCQLAEQLAAAASVGTQMDLTLCTDCRWPATRSQNRIGEMAWPSDHQVHLGF